MNTPSSAVPGSPLDSQARPPAAMSETRPFYWSVQRELWENRSIYLAPLAAAAVFLVGFLISLIGLPHRMRDILALDPSKQREVIAMPYDMAAGLIMLITLVVAAFYCLDALYGERRDRSILFWKSLPVSDLTTVLAKASIPIVLLQLIGFAVTFATHLIMLLLSSVVLMGSGIGVTALWTQLAFFPMSLGLLYHLLFLHGLWYAPFYGWLLLVSSWARRVPILWATLPVLAIGIVEKVAFNTSYFAAMLQYRFAGSDDAAMTSATNFPINPMAHIPALGFLSSPGLWVGLIFAAGFLYAAARMRRYREPI